jgi:hypothetical protein
MEIAYSSAPSGAGKTSQIIRRACQLAHEHKRVLILAPTKELIAKTVAEELNRQPGVPQYHVFHQDTVGGSSVASEITRFFNSAEDAGQIVLATHQVFPYIPHIANKGDWGVVVDEEFQILRYNCHQIPQTHALITDHIELVPYDSIYSRVLVRDLELLAHARNKDGDELLERLRDTGRILCSKHWDTYVNTEQYDKLRNGSVKRLAFHSVLNWQLLAGFGSVFMAAANFEDTAVYRLWSQDVEFKQDQEFSRSLRFSEHQNGHLITIYYATNAQWSKKRAEAASGSCDSQNTRDRLIQATKQLFGENHFLWQANKSMPGNPFGSNAQRLPNKPHGLNAYSEIHNIAFLSALNPPSDHFKFLETRGLTGGDVRCAIYFQAAYQSVMRTSIRDPNNQDPKRIVVPDLPLAEYLQSKFLGSQIDKIDIGIDEVMTSTFGRPRKHRSNRERVAEQRKKAQDKRIRVLNEQIQLKTRQDPSAARCDANGSRCRAKSVIAYTNFGTPPPTLSGRLDSIFMNDFHQQPCCGTLYPDKFSSAPLAYMRWFDEETFIFVLQELHQRKVESKEASWLMSPAIFDPNRVTGTARGHGNIIYLQNLWLDFENGELSPDEFPKLFPRIRMILTNTFRHTVARPRYRVIIPTTQQLTPETYLLLYEQIARKLEDAGYAVPRRNPKAGRTSNAANRQSGLDWSKRLPTSLFYLPSQAADPSQSFFRDYSETARVPLDPIPWISNGPMPLQPELDACSDFGDDDREIDQARVQTAITNWRNSPKGSGNDNFFKFALDLRRAGMNTGQIETMLRSEAAFGHSPNERKAQISSIIKSLQESFRASKQRMP